MINFQFTDKVAETVRLYANGVYDDDQMLPQYLSEAIKCKPYVKIVEIFTSDQMSFQRSIVVRLGNRKSASQKCLEEAGAELFKKCSEGIEDVLVLDLKELGHDGLNLLMGFILSSWQNNHFRTMIKPGENSSLNRVIVLCANPQEMETQFKRLQSIAEGVNYARELTSAPSNILFPQAYVEKLKELEKLDIQVDILDSDMLKKIGFSALLAVGKGSCNPPYVAVLTWNGLKQKTSPIAIVGKGVCFDSGGLCLKPTKDQYDMKWDKAGAGVVAGLIKALALSKTPVHVVGVLGLVENMPDGAATKPGDVITTMSGQTVEIVNTDAEGRLVLADCLWYAQSRFLPKVMIDLGTLTIETAASLGSDYAGLYANDQALAKQLSDAGKISGDFLWELPMGAFFAKQIETPIADMKNVGIDLFGENGAAAEFLKRFIKNIPWAHIDIGGVSWTNSEASFAPKEVTGFGVRMLEEWITNQGGNDES